MDTCLTLRSDTLILMQLILMKATHRHQVLLLSHVPIFMIQTMVKTGKLTPLLTHRYYNFQNLNRMVKVRTLKPLRTQPTMIFPDKYLSQARTPKLHVSLCHNHLQGTVTTPQSLRSTILPQKIFRKTNLVILEAANITYALILIPITQKYIDVEVRKNLFKPIFVRYSHPLIYFYFFRTRFIVFLHFSIFAANVYKC